MSHNLALLSLSFSIDDLSSFQLDTRGSCIDKQRTLIIEREIVPAHSVTMAPTSSSPPGIFTFDEPFGSMTQSFEYNIYPQDRQQTQPHSHAHHHKAHSGELPWKAQTQNSDPSRSIAFQILNSYYSRLDLPPFESELESFRQRYHRDSELVNRAIKLRDGKIQPHPEGGFSPAPRPDQAGSDNTTVFVGGLNPNIHADLIKAIFTPFGAIDYVSFRQGDKG